MLSLGVYSVSQMQHSSDDESEMRGREERKEEQLWLLGSFIVVALKVIMEN